MALIPQIVDPLIPVIAAGGIADGRGLCCRFWSFGAQGVQMGTIFLASEECPLQQVTRMPQMQPMILLLP